MTLDYWPLFGLRVVTPRLELRLPTDEELPALIAQAATVGADGRYFSVPWAGHPEPELGRALAQWHWRTRADWKPGAWHLNLAVFVDGEPVGAQDISADNFGHLGVAKTGSWLGTSHRGGIGTEARAAVLHFGFDTLGAVAMASSARQDNHASLGVSRKLGYEENGRDRTEFGDGTVDVKIRLLLERRRWLGLRRDDIEVHGFDPCAEMFGPPPQGRAADPTASA